MKENIGLRVGHVHIMEFKRRNQKPNKTLQEYKAAVADCSVLVIRETLTSYVDDIRCMETVPLSKLTL